MRINIDRFAKLLFAAIFLTASTAYASEEVADKNACLNCHAISKKSIGPSFKAIGDKYRGQAGAADLLAGKILKGGSGVWGATPMPPMAFVPAEDVKILVTWILK
jgi:cytochrome c